MQGSLQTVDTFCFGENKTDSAVFCQIKTESSVNGSALWAGELLPLALLKQFKGRIKELGGHWEVVTDRRWHTASAHE